LSTYRGSAVIVVKGAQALERIPRVTLVPLPDGRALIALDESMSIQEFELQVRDALERALLSSIVEILTAARHTKGLVVHRRSIIVLKSTRRRRGDAS
jgi:hypothetical protein